MSVVSRIVNKIKRNRDSIKYWKNKGVLIGEDCVINSSAEFGTEPYLVKLGNHVRINAGVQFVTHDGGCWVLRKIGSMEDKENIDLFGSISIGSNVHIGTNAIIMPNVKIGSNCIIGCGAVVTHDIPDNFIVGGVPARIIENVQEYENKHVDDFMFIKGFSQDEKRKILITKFENDLK